MTAQSLPSAAAAARNDAIKREAAALRKRQVLTVAYTLMVDEGFRFDEAVLASSNPRCVRWRELAGVILDRVKECK